MGVLRWLLAMDALPLLQVMGDLSLLQVMDALPLLQVSLITPSRVIASG